jgi:hypothetical protein
MFAEKYPELFKDDHVSILIDEKDDEEDENDFVHVPGSSSSQKSTSTEEEATNLRFAQPGRHSPAADTESLLPKAKKKEKESLWNKLWKPLTALWAPIVACTATGAVIGTVFPGIGTLVGAAAGAITGLVLGVVGVSIAWPGQNEPKVKKATTAQVTQALDREPPESTQKKLQEQFLKEAELHNAKEFDEVESYVKQILPAPKPDQPNPLLDVFSRLKKIVRAEANPYNNGEEGKKKYQYDLGMFKLYKNQKNAAFDHDGPKHKKK